ncbi:MAG: lipid A export permease/ATP-binding protein MsbA [Burkholderiales bacterium]|nr:lipid A export permease/ATP-binding protein MsbA [Burkholderiales bacterium]
MTNKEITRRLIQMMKPYRNRFYLSFLGMVGTALTEPMFPRVLGVLFDDGFGHKPGFQVWTIPAAIIAIFVMRGLCTFSSAYFSNWVISRLLNDLRRAMFDRLLRLPVARFHEESTGAILNTMIAEARQVVEMVTNAFLSIVRDGLVVLGLLSYLLYLNWRLTLVAFILVPASALLVRLSSGRLRRLNRENQRITEEMTQVVEEAARGHQVIRVFAGETYEKNRFEKRSQALLGFSRRITVAAASTVPISQLMSALAVSGVIVLALQQAQNADSVTAGSFIAFISSMLMILAPMKRLAEVNGPIQRGMAAAESVFGLIDAKTEDDPGTVTLQRAKGELRLEHVAFRYNEQNPHALVDTSLTIAAGETVALVGVSGGGKSTLGNLVTRFDAPPSGQIYLDGIAYPDLTLASLRQQIAMVSQNVVLFDDTLAANIAYGVAEIDQTRLENAVRAAHLTEVVNNLPQGLQSPIGENGMRLSGGQRQRVAIARAIYKDAPLLILDEATSALDTESERAVQAALDELMQGRTTLVIAHRLSTIERADRILVLEQGRIVESGRHDALLAQGGIYANLYHLQFAKES